MSTTPSSSTTTELSTKASATSFAAVTTEAALASAASATFATTTSFTASTSTSATETTLWLLGTVVVIEGESILLLALTLFRSLAFGAGEEISLRALNLLTLGLCLGAFVGLAYVECVAQCQLLLCLFGEVVCVGLAVVFRFGLSSRCSVLFSSSAAAELVNTTELIDTARLWCAATKLIDATTELVSIGVHWGICIPGWFFLLLLLCDGLASSLVCPFARTSLFTPSVASLLGLVVGSTRRSVDFLVVGLRRCVPRVHCVAVTIITPTASSASASASTAFSYAS